MSNMVLVTTVRGKYRVVVEYRESSVAMSPPPWFYEITGWELGDDGGYKENTHHEEADGEASAVEIHNRIVRDMLEKETL